MTINVLMNGLGKMGTAVAKRLLQDDEIKILGFIDPKPSTEEGKKLQNRFATTIDITTKNIKSLSLKKLFKSYSGFPIIVDFSNTSACLTACLYSAENGINILSGTTPIPQDYEDQIKDAISKYKIKGIRCPNFSPDVNKFLNELVPIAQNIDPSEDIAIHEIHRLEKASTSGTAALMAKIICKHAGRPGYKLLMEGKAYNAEGIEIPMPEQKKDVLKKYIRISAERFADEPGMHTVTIGDEHNHRIHTVRATRESYAEGAYRGIKFLSEAKEPRQYSFPEDVLKLSMF